MSDSPEVANSGKAVVTPVGDKQIEVVRECRVARPTSACGWAVTIATR